jgi:hypothetical protein
MNEQINETLSQFSQDTYSIETGLRELETIDNLELDEEQKLDINSMIEVLQDFINRLKLLRDKQ